MKLQVIKEDGLYWVQCVCCGQIDYMSYKTKKLAQYRAKLFTKVDLPIFDRRTGITATHSPKIKNEIDVYGVVSWEGMSVKPIKSR